MYTNSWPSAQESARGPQEVRFYISQEVQIPIPSKNASEDKIREQTKNYIMMEQQTLLICLAVADDDGENTEWQPMFAILLMKTSYYNIIQWMDLALHPLRYSTYSRKLKIRKDTSTHRYITIFFHNHARQIHIINSTGFQTKLQSPQEYHQDLKQVISSKHIITISNQYNHLTKGRIKLQHKFSSLNFHFYQFLNLYIILYIQIAHEVKAQGHKKMRMLVFSYQFQLQKNNLEHQFRMYDKTKWARVTILVYNEGLSDMLLHISAGEQVAAESDLAGMQIQNDSGARILRIIASICNSLIEGFSDIFLNKLNITHCISTILTNYNCEQTVPDRNRVPGPQERFGDIFLIQK
ncbi:hypothetical protein ACJX0J_025187 [Zea mays]